MQLNNEQINDHLYTWADQLNKETFKYVLYDIVQHHYVPYSSKFCQPIGLVNSRTNRASEVITCIKDDKSNNVKVLARIFSKGAITSSSLNFILLKNIFLHIQNNNQLLHVEINESLLRSLSHYAQKRLSPVERANNTRPIKIPSLQEISWFKIKEENLPHDKLSQTVMEKLQNYNI